MSPGRDRRPDSSPGATAGAMAWELLAACLVVVGRRISRSACEAITAKAQPTSCAWHRPTTWWAPSGWILPSALTVLEQARRRPGCRDPQGWRCALFTASGGHAGASAALTNAIYHAPPGVVFAQWRQLVLDHPGLYLRERWPVFRWVVAPPDMLCLSSRCRGRGRTGRHAEDLGPDRPDPATGPFPLFLCREFLPHPGPVASSVRGDGAAVR